MLEVNMKLDYKQKEDLMKMVFDKWLAPASFRSSYKGVPMDNYEGVKQFIDFTKYYVMFRGPRPQSGFKGSTRKRYAHSFDIYRRSDRDTLVLRTEREAFMRGVQWAKENV
jgi:hypothetical protein